MGRRKTRVIHIEFNQYCLAAIPGIGVTSFIFPAVLLLASALFAWFAFVALRKGAAPTKSKMIHAKEQPVAFGVLTTLYLAVAVLALIGAVVLFGTIAGVMSA